MTSFEDPELALKRQREELQALLIEGKAKAANAPPKTPQEAAEASKRFKELMLRIQQERKKSKTLIERLAEFDSVPDVVPPVASAFEQDLSDVIGQLNKAVKTLSRYQQRVEKHHEDGKTQAIEDDRKLRAAIARSDQSGTFKHAVDKAANIKLVKVLREFTEEVELVSRRVELQVKSLEQLKIIFQEQLKAELEMEGLKEQRELLSRSQQAVQPPTEPAVDAELEDLKRQLDNL
jgi:hypothetical protein